MKLKTILKVAAAGAAVWVLILRRPLPFIGGGGAIKETAQNKNDTGVVRGAA